MIIARLDCLNGNCDRLTFSGAKFLSSLSFLLFNDSGYPHGLRLYARRSRYSYIAKGTSFRERNVHFAKGTFISRKDDFFLRKEDIISNLNTIISLKHVR